MIAVVLVKAVSVVALLGGAHSGSGPPSTYTVAPGNTLSGIAASNGVSLSQIEAANPQITDPNVITVGETVNLGSGSASGSPSTSAAPVATTGDGDSDGDDASTGASSEAPAQQSTPAQAPSAGSDQGSSPSTSAGQDGSGLSGGLWSCIKFRESTNGQLSHNLFGIIGSTWAADGGTQFAPSAAQATFAQQGIVAQRVMNTAGPSAWAADGCPGT